MAPREHSFDGLVGTTHNYGGLSRGNVASTSHGGLVSSPRGAALQGIAKMRFVSKLGVRQGVLPPQPRPSLTTLRRLGFVGSDEEVVTRAARDAEHLLRLCSSASAMWTANAATVAPSADTMDGRVHFVPANLTAMFHRAIEPDTTHAVLSAIFADRARFAVHAPLPGGAQLADEGAANHTRLVDRDGRGVHLFAYGRSAFGDTTHPTPKRFPARQTREASEAVARLCMLDPSRTVFAQQHADGIDAGAFHTDVLAVGSGALLLLHELAFADRDALLATLREKLGDAFRFELATSAELPALDAVRGYAFNSQLVSVGERMAIVAPLDAMENAACDAFLRRAASAHGLDLHPIDVRQSMQNGGGPACLRLRVTLEDAEVAAVSARVFFDDALGTELEAWATKHHRERLAPDDLRDPALARESMQALDTLTGILRLGSVYDFQRSPR